MVDRSIMQKVLQNRRTNISLTRRYNSLTNSFNHQRKSKKSLAFTLAEVLITLGIIGVVAAITIPSLMTSYKARKLRSQFLKSYSVVQQAIRLMEADGEESFDALDYDRSTGEAFYKPFLKYVTGATDCGAFTRNNVNCYNTQTQENRYKNLTGTSKISNAYFDDGQIILADGTLLIFEQPRGVDRLWIFMDINGVNEKPNRLGYDLFALQMTDKGLKAMGDADTTYVGDTYCSTAGTGGWNGMSCTNKAKTDPDYFKRITKSIK